MANVKELDAQIESTQVELQTMLARLKAFDELQGALDGASTGLQDGGDALTKLSEHLALTTESLDSAIQEFKAAVDAMRAATPEALSHNVDLAVGATERTEQNSAAFQAQMKEEIAEQRETLERRVLAVESGLEQTRGNIGQLKNHLDDRFDDLGAGSRSSSRWILFWVLLSFVLLAASAGAHHMAELRQLFGGGG